MTTTTETCPNRYYDTQFRAWVERIPNPGTPAPRKPRRWELKEDTRASDLTVGNLAAAGAFLIGVAAFAACFAVGAVVVAGKLWHIGAWY